MQHQLTPIEELYHSVLVERKSSIQPEKSLMKSTKIHAVLTAGSTVNLLTALNMASSDLPAKQAIPIQEPREIKLNAQWKYYKEEKARSGRDSSVFGDLGVFLPDISKAGELPIPIMNALSVPYRFMQKYGAQLIRLDESITLEKVHDATLAKLPLVEYHYDENYFSQYIMNEKGGGGVFIETHPFPQVFVPLSPQCRGGVILGVTNGHGRYDLMSLQIPYGYALKINSGVIHGDAHFVGPYAIALTETEHADSVLFKRNTFQREIQPVYLRKVDPVIFPFFAEKRLAEEAILKGQALIPCKFRG